MQHQKLKTLHQLTDAQRFLGWLVPGEGFEPPTFGLQNRCTTTVLTRRAAWLTVKAGLHQHLPDPRRLVFVDQTWVKTNMTRTRGRSLRGTPLLAKVPHGPIQPIYGHARSRGLVIVTGSLGEFQRVPGLRCEDWQV